GTAPSQKKRSSPETLPRSAKTDELTQLSRDVVRQFTENLSVHLEAVSAVIDTGETRSSAARRFNAFFEEGPEANTRPSNLTVGVTYHLVAYIGTPVAA